MGVSINGYTITKEQFNCNHYFKPMTFEGDDHMDIVCAECKMTLLIVYKKYMVFGGRARIINNIKLRGYNYKDLKTNTNEIKRKLKTDKRKR